MIPTIIPRRRTKILMLSLIFVSAIIISSTSVLFSFQSVWSGIYGDYDDVAVIYDHSAQTPFTSVVPKSLESILREFDGVLNVSAEMISPVTIDNDPTYLRGVNWNDASAINTIDIVQGASFSEKDSSIVMVGENLATRLDLKINDLIEVSSTVKSQRIKVRIVGIFSSSNYKQNDEILAPLPLSEKLFERYNNYNHILVKYDKKEIRSQDIFDYIQSTNEVEVFALLNNGTEYANNWELIVWDTNYRQIQINTVKLSAKIDLPFGIFYFQARLGENSTEKIRYVIDGNTTINLNIDPIQYKVRINVTSSEFHIKKLKYEIIDDELNSIRNGEINSLNYTETILEKGKYNIKFYRELNTKIFDLYIDKPENIMIDIGYIEEKISFISGLTNNTVMKENVGVFHSTQLLDEYDVFIDGNITETIYTKIPFNLTDGDHSIEIYSLIKKLIRYEFKIDSAFNYMDTISFNNNSRVNYGDILTFNSTGISTNMRIQAYINDKKIEINNKDDQLILVVKTNYTGYSRVRIEVTTLSGNFISKNYYYYIYKENAPVAGLLTPINNLSIKNTSFIQFRSNDYLSEILLNDVLVQYNETHINLPNLDIGTENTLLFKTINSNYSSNTYILNRVDSFTTSLKYVENNISFNFTDNMNVFADNMEIKFNDDEFTVEINNGINSFSVNSGMIPTYINNIAIQSITIRSKITNEYSTINLTVLGGDPNKSIPLSLLNLHTISDGIVDTLDLYNNNLEWNFYKENNVKNSIVKNGDKVYLNPGKWIINIVDTLNTISWNKSINVVKYTQKLFINNTQVITGNIRMNITGEIYILENIWYEINNTWYYNNYYDLNDLDKYFAYENSFDNSKRKIINNKLSYNNSLIEIDINKSIRSANITLEWNNNILEFEYNGFTKLNLNISSFTIITLNISSIDVYGEYHNFSFIYRINKNDNPTELYFINYDEIYGNSTVKVMIENPISNFEYKFEIDFSNYDPNMAIILPDYLIGEVIIRVNSFYFNWNYYINSEQIIIDLMINNSTIYTKNNNFNSQSEYYGSIMIIDALSLESYEFFYSQNIGIPVLYSDFKFQIDNEIIDNFDIIGENIIIEKKLINITGTLEIIGLIYVYHDLITITHLKSNYSADIVGDNMRWNIIDFPIGLISVQFKQGVKKFNYTTWYSDNNYNLFIYVNSEDKPIVNLLSKGNAIQIGSSSEFSDQSFEGPIILVKLLVYTEIIVILIALSATLIGVFIGLISDSRHELIIARNIGFTNIQLLRTTVKEIKYISFISVFVGGLLGMLINYLLFEISSSVFFGYSFIPSYGFGIWLFDFLSIYFMVYISTYFGLKVEKIFIV